MLFSLFLSFTNYDLLHPVVRGEVGRAGTTTSGCSPTTRTTGTSVAGDRAVRAGRGAAQARRRARASRCCSTASGAASACSAGLFYLPSLLGGSVALALVWRAMFSRGRCVQRAPRPVRHRGQAVGQRPGLGAGTLIVLAIWQFGAPMVIFLAGLKQIPTELYEAAVGRRRRAGWRQFWHVTLPMLSPVIFFNLVLETIHGFQGFTSAFVHQQRHRRPGRLHPDVHAVPLHQGLHRLPDGLRLRDGLGVPGRRSALITVVLFTHRPVLGALLGRGGR